MLLPARPEAACGRAGPAEERNGGCNLVKTATQCDPPMGDFQGKGRALPEEYPAENGHRWDLQGQGVRRVHIW